MLFAKKVRLSKLSTQIEMRTPFTHSKNDRKAILALAFFIASMAIMASVHLKQDKPSFDFAMPTQFANQSSKIIQSENSQRPSKNKSPQPNVRSDRSSNHQRSTEKPKSSRLEVNPIKIDSTQSKPKQILKLQRNHFQNIRIHSKDILPIRKKLT